MKKWLLSFKEKRKKKKYEKIDYRLDQNTSPLLQILDNFFLSNRLAFIFGTSVKYLLLGISITKKGIDYALSNYKYRMAIFLVSFITILCLAVVGGLKGIEGISATSNWPDSTKKTARITFKFDLTNQKYDNSNGTFSLANYEDGIKTSVQNQINLLSNDTYASNNTPTDSNKIDTSELKYSIINNTSGDEIAVDGPIVSLQAIKKAESQFINVQTGLGKKVTLTDQYGRPLVAGLKFDKINGQFDPTHLENPNYIINSTGKTGENGDTNGQTIGQILGKWYGKTLQGNIFASASASASSNDSEQKLMSFTLSKDNFFQIYTKYLYIAQADYQYRYETVNSWDNYWDKRFDDAKFIGDTGKGTTFKIKPNNGILSSNDKTNNAMISSMNHYSYILVWIDQEKIFSSSVNFSSDGNGTITLNYHFKWTNPTWQSFASAFITNHVDDSYDSSGNAWFIDRTKEYTNNDEFMGGYNNLNSGDDTNHEKDVPNFLDFSFDHVYHQLDLSKKAKDSTIKEDYYSKAGKNISQEWYAQLHSPYKSYSSENTSVTKDGSNNVNPNFNVLHPFYDSDKSEIMTLGYMQSSGYPLITFNNKKNLIPPFKADWGNGKKPNNNADIWTERWKPYSFFLSPFNKKPSSQSSSISNSLINKAFHPFGLVSVQSIQTGDSSFGSGISSWNTNNSTISTHPDDKPSVDYYNTADWTENVPEHSRPPQGTKTALDNQETYKISDYGVYYANQSINPSALYTGSITYYSTYDSNGTVVQDIFLLVILINSIILLVYLILKYRLIGVIISMFAGILVLFDFRSINEFSTKYNEALPSILLLGIAFFLISAGMVIKGIRKRYISYEKRNPENKGIYSRGLIRNFIDIFFVIFFSAYLILINKNAGLLQSQATLIATQVIAIFGLVTFLFRFLLLTLLINPYYKRYDKYLFKFNKKNEYSFREKEIVKYGPDKEINDRNVLITKLSEEISHDSHIFKNKNSNLDDPSALYIISGNPFNDIWNSIKKIIKYFKLFEKKKFQRVFKEEINLKAVNKTYNIIKSKQSKSYKAWHNFVKWIFPLIFIVLTTLSIAGIILNVNDKNSNIIRFDNRSQNQGDDFITITPNVRNFFADASGLNKNYQELNNSSIKPSFYNNDPTDPKSQKTTGTGNYIAACNYSLNDDKDQTIPLLLKDFMSDTNKLKQQINIFTSELNLVYHDTNTYVDTNNRESALLQKGFSFKGFYISFNLTKYNEDKISNTVSNDIYYVKPYNGASTKTNYTNSNSTNKYETSDMLIQVPVYKFAISSYLHTFNKDSKEVSDLIKKITNYLKNLKDNSLTFYQNIETNSQTGKNTSIPIFTEFGSSIANTINDMFKTVLLLILFVIAIILLYLFIRYKWQNTISFGLGIIFSIFWIFAILSLIFPINTLTFSIFGVCLFVIIFNMIYFIRKGNAVVNNYEKLARWKFTKKSDILKIAFNTLLGMKSVILTELLVFTIFSVIWIILFKYPILLGTLGILHGKPPGIDPTSPVDWNSILNVLHLSSWWEYGLLSAVGILITIFSFVFFFLPLWINLTYLLSNSRKVFKMNSLFYHTDLDEHNFTTINDYSDKITLKEVKKLNPEFFTSKNATDSHLKKKIKPTKD